MQIPFIEDAYRGEIPINWFPASDQERGVVMFGCAGLKSRLILGDDFPIRALKKCGSNLYVVYGPSVYVLDVDLSPTPVGGITSQYGHVWIEYNGYQVVFCDGQDYWVYNENTQVFQQVGGTEFPGAAYLTYQDGYGIWGPPNSNRFYVTNLDDFLGLDYLNFATLEGLPDNIVVAKSHYRELWIFGERTIEIWQNVGTSPFPFARAQGAYVEQGCGASASIGIGDNVIYWLSQHRQVLSAVGYQPTIISSRKLERELADYETVADAIGFVWVNEGHTFYQLTFPNAKVTWVYDAATQIWHKRSSFEWPGETLQGQHRANCYAHYNDLHLVGDYATGTIYGMDRDYFDDDGEPLVAQLQSMEIRQEGKLQFFPPLQIYFEHGQGLTTGQGFDPQAMLSWSNDGGFTWGPELWSPIGKIGEYGTRSIWRRGGSAYTRSYRLMVSDPVKRDILEVNWL